MNYDNPASRLLSLLQAGKKKSQQTNCRAVWDELLDTKGNAPLLMARLGKVMELPQLAISAMQETIPGQANMWSHWEGQVNAGFMSQNLNATWDTFINHIDSHTFTYLHMTAELLEAKSNLKVISSESLESIKTKLESLLEQIIDSSESMDVKAYLVRNIRKMIISIEEYQITGSMPILESIDTTLGHMALDKSYYSFLTSTDLGKKILDTLGSMANVITVAVGLPQLTLAIAQLTN